MWKYYNPVEVVFGTGKLDELGQLMAERGLDRALIVSDPFTHRSGVAARLKECAGGRVLDIISEVEPNPTCDNVDACARRARELGARSIIGLGGGILGLSISYILSWIINTVIAANGAGETFRSVIPFYLAVGALVFSILVGVLAGLYPSQRAMRLSALAAIRNE